MNVKNVLVLYKKSSYSIYFEHPRSSFNKRGIAPLEISRFKKTHQKHSQCLRKVEAILKKTGVHYVKAARGSRIDFNRFDLIISVGGDGTFLEAARGIKNQLILGVNSDPSWSVGKFCSATAETFESVLQRFLLGKGSVRILQRLKLQVGDHSAHALNDILVCHHNPAAMSRYYLTVGKIKEEQKSSGVWIATAAGSSGAIRSVGGKQLPIQSEKIQYKPRELYSGRGNIYKLRGGILAPQVKLQVTSLMREGFVFVDGSHVCFPFDSGETVTISRSSYPVQAVWSR